jgi:NAD(P)-dependent dehydrogenase (short-subunit alcohol dehydrogenase family)
MYGRGRVSVSVAAAPLALITGASSGIGRATALRLARGGWDVLAGVRDPAVGAELRRESGGRVEPIPLDVTDEAQIAAAAERVAGASGEGRLDGLVNNAGIGVGGPLELVDTAELRRQFEVNVFAQVAMTNAVLPALRRARGRVVFVSSIGGRVPMAFTAPYAASKHAIEAIADALRVELRTSGIKVALIEPGSVATAIWEKARGQASELIIPAALEREYGHVPAAMEKSLRETERRGVHPDEVAATIERALASRRMRARYVVGFDARAMLFVRRVLPDHVFDRVARLALGV